MSWARVEMTSNLHSELNVGMLDRSMASLEDRINERAIAENFSELCRVEGEAMRFSTKINLNFQFQIWIGRITLRGKDSV